MRFINLVFYSLFAFLLLITGNALAQDQPLKPFESTVAYQLLLADQELYGSNAQEIKYCKSLMEDACKRITRVFDQKQLVNGHGETALRVLRMIDSTFTEHRFLYAQASVVPGTPSQHFDFLTPAFRDSYVAGEYLYTSFNPYRREYWKRRPDERCRLIDCDLYSYIYFSIGQMAGLPITMVEIPDHNYLRWYLTKDVWLSWDAIYGEPYRDDSTPDKSLKSRFYDWNRKHYLFNWTTQDMMAYYFYRRACLYNFTTGFIDLKKAKRDYERSLELRYNDPATLCNHVWLYITNPAFDTTFDFQQLMTEINLALSMEDNFNFYDAKACLYALNKDFTNAVLVSEAGIKIPNGYEKQREKAKAHLLCFKENKVCREIK